MKKNIIITFIVIGLFMLSAYIIVGIRGVDFKKDSIWYAAYMRIPLIEEFPIIDPADEPIYYIRPGDGGGDETGVYYTCKRDRQGVSEILEKYIVDMGFHEKFKTDQEYSYYFNDQVYGPFVYVYLTGSGSFTQVRCVFVEKRADV